SSPRNLPNEASIPYVKTGLQKWPGDMPRSNHTLAYIARKANVMPCGIFARSAPPVDDSIL
ncbi:hypothetical protein LXJ59_24575, partial [Escherichia coli]|nr:hypothetical protein [Escherichia coli]